MADIEELRQEVSDLRRRVQNLEERLQTGGPPVDTSSLRSFVESTNPSSHTERALAIGYHVDFYMGEEAFTVNDIENGYTECRLQPPSNTSDVLGRAEDNGWLLRAGSEGRTTLWRVSAEGQDLIERKLEQN